MARTYCSIDFEYKGTAEARLDLICCSFQYDGLIWEYWLRDEVQKYKCKQKLLDMRNKGVIFLCWNYVAEGQSFISLGLHPAKFKVIDLMVEYRMLLNHYHKYSTGKHLVKGKIVNFGIPKYGEQRNRPPSSLASGTYKLLGKQIDTDHKDEMRDICINGTPEQLEIFKQHITEYCTSDVKYLPEIWEVIRSEYEEYFKRAPGDYEVKEDHLYWRSETMARTALMISEGYPVDVEKMKNFAGNVKKILIKLCEDINSQFEYDLFKWNNKNQIYSKNTLMMKKIIEESEYRDIWDKTELGNYSLRVESFEKHFNYSHKFPRDCPFIQYLRYLKTYRSLNGFTPKGSTTKNKETIFDSLGNDGRVRCYLNPYGAQSGRYQPKATSFIPLKSAWMRSLIGPKKGRAIAAIDYKSQEFLLGGLVSGDSNMLDAYESGDVYLYFAKLAGAVPAEGTREEYKRERDLFKATTLGISYLMGPKALGRKLTADTGMVQTTEDAKRLIEIFNKAYPEYTKWQNAAYYTYGVHRFWQLEDGWTMFGDNGNDKSVKNMPIQGMGSAILRKAIQLAQDAGLTVIYPLHDAIYIEFDSHDLRPVDVLLECMVTAFYFYFEGEMQSKANKLIDFDIDIWSPDYEDGTGRTPDGNKFKRQTIYVDERSKEEYEYFKEYME